MNPSSGVPHEKRNDPTIGYFANAKWLNWFKHYFKSLWQSYNALGILVVRMAKGDSLLKQNKRSHFTKPIFCSLKQKQWAKKPYHLRDQNKSFIQSFYGMKTHALISHSANATTKVKCFGLHTSYSHKSMPMF